MGKRLLDPNDIKLPPQYKIDVLYEGLNCPINLIVTQTGQMFIADSGVTDGNGKVLQYTSKGVVLVADGFRPPLTGINYYKGKLYISHRGSITTVDTGGKKEDIITGLPSWGDHHNNRVVFGPDEKMYFGQGTATNSGVVGEDNEWVKSYPYFHDYPGETIELSGTNFVTANILTKAKENTTTGAFSPYGVATEYGEKIKGVKYASGSILRANPDGSDVELIAWGLRNPFRILFDKQNQLYALNHGMDERGSRHIANSPDEFHLIRKNTWYGWPDFTGGYPVTLEAFKPEGKNQPEFLLSKHPMHPPMPLVNFPPHSATMGFDFSYNNDFGYIDNVFVAEFGSGAPGTTGGKPAPKVGHRVSRIDMRTGNVYVFARNRSGVAASIAGEGGFERPIDIVFRKNEMYVLDMGIMTGSEGFIPGTGVIWVIKRVNN